MKLFEREPPTFCPERQTERHTNTETTPSLIIDKNMLIILSPAKTLTVPKSLAKSLQTSSPSMQKTMDVLLTELRKMSASQLASTLEVSSSIANLNLERYKNWEKQQQYPCGFAFDGPAYKGLSCSTLSEKELNYLQTHLRIVDPLYGLLKPLDLIRQYRLEMKTKGLKATKETKGGLAAFWSKEMTESLIKDLDEQERTSGSSSKSNSDSKSGRFILNVASQEYSKVLDRKLLEENNVKVFDMIIEGSTYDAKFGRGCAARYCAKNDVKTMDDLKNFTGSDLDGSKSWKLNEKSAKTVEGKSMCFSFSKSEGGGPAPKKQKKK
jgi:cytoplasmic iron level regulating protein YaaA (DUF328/UPF0246 family)